MTEKNYNLDQITMYPLRFEPIYEYRLWGGRRLSNLLSAPLPNVGSIGEAWVLSDRNDYPSHVADGPLKGWTIGQLLEQSSNQLLGDLSKRFQRFPLLLKFLDAQEMLSVQVHPSDAQSDLLPAGETGKTEAWIVLEAEMGSRIYAGLKSGTTEDDLRAALKNDSVTDQLAYFTPRPDEGIFIPAGTIHTLGGGVVVFEVEQNSDMTFRLYDWDRVDAKTGNRRDLQADKALSCINFKQGEVSPVISEVEAVIPVVRERLFNCEYFRLWRLHGESSFMVGATGKPRVLVCIAGAGQLEYKSANYAVRKGDVFLLPAVVGVCTFQPHGMVTLLEIAIPE